MKGFIKVHALRNSHPDQSDIVYIPVAHITAIHPVRDTADSDGPILSYGIECNEGSYRVTETLEQLEELINNA